MKKLRTLWHKLDILFPDQHIYKKFTIRQAILLFLPMLLLFTFVGKFLPVGGLFAWDWVHFTSIHQEPSFYPPWTLIFTDLLTWQLLVGLTLTSFSLAILLRSSCPLSMIFAFLSLPLLWVLFLGQLEGLALLGLLGLPWLIPLALIKPQVTFFALLARRSYLIAFIILLFISLLIWGFWPARMFASQVYFTRDQYPQNIGLGLWGIPLFC
jgi:hypothetical protein